MADLDKIRVIKNGVTTDYEVGGSSDVYSTEEQVIGRWINNKPLYEKIVPFNMTSIRTTENQKLEIGHNISNVDYIFISSDASHYKVNDNSYAFSRCFVQNSSIGFCCTASVNDTNVSIELYYPSAGANVTGYILLKYTKTTDTVGGAE